MTDLKIETGKCYETRDGRKAHVVYYDERGFWFGLVQNAPATDNGFPAKPDIEIWYENGRCDVDSNRPADLISEWKEPRKGEWSVNIGEMDGELIPMFYSNEEEAIEGARFLSPKNMKIVARAPLIWTEGQGLDGEGGE